MHNASTGIREGCVRLLLESKANVNATQVSLERALPQAHLPWTSCPVLIQWIVHQQDNGCTALMAAAEMDNEGCVRLLLESKASVNATDVSLERDALPPSTPAMDQLAPY